MSGDRPGEFTEQQVILGDALHGSTIGSSPIHSHMISWMNDWRIGDVVIERSTRHSQRPWQTRIGIMMRVYDKPLFEEDGITQFATDRHWVLATNDGEFDWYNADFFRIPTREHQARLLEGYADRCIVCGDCRDCARETWIKRPGSNLWHQQLRRKIFREKQPGEVQDMPSHAGAPT